MTRRVAQNPGRRRSAGALSRSIAALVLGIAAAAESAAAPAPAIAIAARSIQPGELLVLTIRTPPDATAVEVRAFGATLPAERADAGRWRALAGVDLDQAPGESTIVGLVHRPLGVDTIEQPIVVRAKRFPTRRLKVDPDFVNPPEALRSRIEHEAALLHDVYARSAGEPLWSVPFVRPVPGAANSRFGTRSVFNGEPRNPHAGADLMSGAGTPVHAPNAGRIALARSLYFSGNTVIVDHGGGVFSMLAHLSRIDVHEGDAIARGAVVGLVGATGRVTGPHLHWALRVGNARVDPLAALALLGKGAGAGAKREKTKSPGGRGSPLT